MWLTVTSKLKSIKMSSIYLAWWWTNLTTFWSIKSCICIYIVRLKWAFWSIAAISNKTKYREILSPKFRTLENGRYPHQLNFLLKIKKKHRRANGFLECFCREPGHFFSWPLWFKQCSLRLMIWVGQAVTITLPIIFMIVLVYKSLLPHTKMLP